MKKKRQARTLIVPTGVWASTKGGTVHDAL